jgi:transposase
MGRIIDDAAHFHELRSVRGEDRGQAALLPSALEDYVNGGRPVRVIDAFVSRLKINGPGFGRAAPAGTGVSP